LSKLTLKRIDDLRLRFSSNSDRSSSLVDEINSRIGQSSRCEVAGSQVGSGYKSAIEDGNTVVTVISLFETSKNGNRFRNAGLLNDDLLESTLKGGILLNILAVFGKSSGTDTV
jgi:hypothetical protein